MRFGADAVTIFRCGGNIRYMYSVEGQHGMCFFEGALFITFKSLTSLETPVSCQPVVLYPFTYSFKLLVQFQHKLHSTTDNMDVPTKTSLADIYPEDAQQAQTTRWNSLLKTFRDTYGKSADFVSRSPGRVNIIGEVSGIVTALD